MKQYWRVSEIRVLSSLALGMLVIGKLYLDFVPVFRDMGLLGAVTLGMILFSVFLALGWIYDTKLRMWSQKNQAIVERNAYYHVPLISSLAFEYPILYAFINTLNSLSDKLKTDGGSVKQLAEYLDEYFQQRPTRADIDHTLEMGKEFMEDHPFVTSKTDSDVSTPLSSRIKLGWETQILRLTWIQSLTGLVQDVLVLGVLYVFLLYPGATEESALFLATFGVSLPLLFVMLLLGWIYDMKLKVWSADLEVKIERNPYSYVLEPSLLAFAIPFYYTALKILYESLEKLELDTQGVEKIIQYMNEYTMLQSSRSEDLVTAVKLRSSLGTIFQED